MDENIFDATDIDMDKLSIFYENDKSIWILMFILFLATHSKKIEKDKEEK